MFKAFIAAAQSDPEVAEAFRSAWVTPRRDTSKAVLERHQQHGRLTADLDLDLFLDLLYGPLYYRLLAGHGPLTAEFADAIADRTLQCFS